MIRTYATTKSSSYPHEPNYHQVGVDNFLRDSYGIGAWPQYGME